MIVKREFIENGVPLVVYDDGRIFTKDRYIVIVRLLILELSILLFI